MRFTMLDGEPTERMMKMGVVRDDREMILHPNRWPLLALPLVRDPRFQDGNTAVFYPPLNVTEINPDEPIEIRLGNIYEKLSGLPRKQYANVDALLADGWRVD